LAYVPTRFINQSLQPAEFEVNPDESINEHVAVIRTVLEAAGIELGNHQPGSNLLNKSRTDEFVLTTLKNKMGTFDIYSADSILWRRGLRVLFQQPGPTAGVCCLPELLGNRKPRNAAQPGVRRQPHLRSDEFGACQKTVDEANELLNEKLKGIEERDSSSFEISNRQRGRLKKLSYIE
jgi:hypothetical protein